MRILFFFSNHHLSHITAQPGIALKLATKAFEQKHTVAILSNSDGTHKQIKEDVRLYLFNGLGDFTSYIKNLNLIINAIISFKPDVVHIHGNLLLIMYCLLNIIFRKPITFFISETIDILTPRQKPIFIWFLRQTKHIFVTSNFIKQELIVRGISEKKISIVHVGIADPFYDEPKKVPETTDILFFGDSFVARGFDRVIDLVKALPEYSFQILLRWNDEKELKKIKNAPNVSILHYPYKIPLQTFIKQSKLILLPFRFMGVRPPVSILEAMMLEKCVVTSTMGGNEEVILNNIDGILDEFANLESTKERLVSLLANEKLRLTIGNRARRKMLTMYNKDEYRKIIDQIKIVL